MTILHENSVLQISSGVWGQTAPNGGDSRLMSAGASRPRESCGSAAENRADYASDNAAYRAIAPKLGCSPDSLRAWCQQADRDAGQRSGLTSEEKVRLKALERENRELRQANEILKKASAYFAQAELDRPFKR